MPTRVTVTVDDGSNLGGAQDYSSLNAAEAGEQRDLVSADEIAEIELYSFVDGTAADFAGWTTDATRYADIVVADGHGHGGVFTDDGSAYLIEALDANVLNFSDMWHRVTGVQVRNTLDDRSRDAIGVAAGTGGQQIRDCICAHSPFSNFGANSKGIDVGPDFTEDVLVQNCIIFGFDPASGETNAFGVSTGGTGGSSRLRCYNVTVVDCQNGLDGGGEIVAKNCIAQVTSGTGFQGLDATPSVTNLASDTSGDIQATLTFEDAANNNYDLDSGDTDAIDAGTDLSSDADFPFSDDIIGTTRPEGSAWDIGAFEFVSAGGGATTLTADPGSFSITGTDANLEYNRVLAADAGSVTVTGTDASLEHNRVLAADPGSVAITGTDAALQRSLRLNAEAGSVAVTGTDANLEQHRVLTADAGSVTITGVDATLTYNAGVTLTADPGAVTVTGTDAGLLYSRVLTAEAGSVAASGTDADLLRALNLSAEPGSYTVTGTAADLLRSLALSAEAGAVALTGTDVAFIRALILSAEAGSVVVTGTDATLIDSATQLNLMPPYGATWVDPARGALWVDPARAATWNDPERDATWS